tara:strand:+ start:120 stop:665 length:546 start_codon:yes stop_codon:yes gene_type:complete
MNIDNYIYCKNYINHDECDLLVELMKDYQWKKHVWYSPIKDQSHPEEKDCEVCLPKEEVKNILINKIKLALSGYVKKIQLKSAIFHKFANPRLNRYSVGQHMKEHFDHIHSLFDGEVKGVPVLSLVGSLNDDFEGGEFYLNQKPIEINKGDILIFPSSFMYPHAVKPITKGKRYSYAAWAF